MTAIATELDTAAWKAVLEELSLPCRDPFFTPEYHALHVANGDGGATCTSVREGESLLLVPGIRMPIPAGNAHSADPSLWDLQTCNGYGGPLATPGATLGFLQRAWDRWREQCREQHVVAAFFRLHPLLANETCLPADARILRDRQTVFLDLTAGLDALWRNAKSQCRNMVSKARRQHVEIRWNDPEDWKAFEAFYDAAMDRLAASSALRFSHAYFEALRDMPGAELASVRDGSGLLAVSVFLAGSTWCHYHLSARDPRAGNHLHSAILQAALDRCSARGLRGLHLGGGRSAAPNDALLRFKLNTGGTPIDFKVALVVADQDRYDALCAAWASAEGCRPSWLLGYRQPRTHADPMEIVHDQ